MHLEGDAQDGLVFLSDSVRAEPIREAATYPGVRITMVAELARARIPIQCDVGFGDWIDPEAVTATFPVLLRGSSAPTLRVYRQEAVVAEKLEAMVKLSRYNSRMKDYFDLYYLFVYGKLHRPWLQLAISRTFERRQTPLPTELPAGLTDEFAAEKQRMWQAFVTRNSLRAPELQRVVEIIRKACWPSLLNPRLKQQRRTR